MKNNSIKFYKKLNNEDKAHIRNMCLILWSLKRRQVHNILTGKAMPTAIQLIDMAKFYNVHPADIISRVEVESNGV